MDSTPAENFLDQDWNDVLQVNLNTVWILSRDVGRHMLASRGGVTGEDKPADFNPRGNGKIINIASLLSFQGELLCDMVDPHISRHANRTALIYRRSDCACIRCGQAWSTRTCEQPDLRPSLTFADSAVPDRARHFPMSGLRKESMSIRSHRATSPQI